MRLAWQSAYSKSCAEGAQTVRAGEAGRAEVIDDMGFGDVIIRGGVGVEFHSISYVWVRDLEYIGVSMLVMEQVFYYLSMGYKPLRE